MDEFLQNVKPLFGRVLIERMYSSFDYEIHHSNIIDMCANFLEGNNLKILRIGKTKAETL